MSIYTQPVISYADTTIGAIFFNITPRAEGAEVESIRAAAHRGDASQEPSSPLVSDYFSQLALYIDKYHHSLVVHEWFHILQAITYPALYLRSLRELRLVVKILADF